MKHQSLIKILGTGLLTVGLCSGLPAATVDQPTEPSAPLVSGLGDLKKLNRKLVASAEKIIPATVGLVSLDGTGAGSGVVVSRDGLILSAAHVISSLSGEVIVLFPDGSTAKAKSLGADFDRDAAMLQITDPGTYPYVDIAGREPLPINEWCVALGHPGGYDPMRPPPVRLGRVLHNRNFMITDCAVVGGDSGGPLFDTSGRVIGIHSNIGTTLSANRHVPINVFIDQWDDLHAGKRSGTRFAGNPDDEDENKDDDEDEGDSKIDEDRLTLGLKLDEKPDQGVTITEVIDGTPAAKAGLKAGDVLGKVAGKKVTSRKKFAEMIGKYELGEKVPMMVFREGKKKRFKVGLVRLGDLKGAADDDEGIGADAEAKLDAYIDKVLRTMKNGKLEIKLTPEQIEEFGGEDHIQKRIRERLKKQSGKTDKDNGPDTSEGEKLDEDTEAKLDAYIDEVLKTVKDGKLELKLTPEEIEEFGGTDHIQKRIQERLNKPSGKKKKTQARNKPETEDSDDSAQAALDAYLEKMLKNGTGGGMEIELTPQQIKSMGGMAKLLEAFKEEGLAGVVKDGKENAPDEFFQSSMKALESVTHKVTGSTASVLADEKEVALGTVVTAEGGILTKDTETREGTITIRLDGKNHDATLVRRFPEHDLALFHIEAENLHPVTLDTSADGPLLASLLTVTSPADKPAGIGVVSVRSRALGQVGFLGIVPGEADGGVLVETLVEDGAAAKAGIKQGDVIISIDGDAATSPIKFAQKVRGRKVAETIQLEVLHDDGPQVIDVKLGLRPTREMNGRFLKMNKMSGPLSEKLDGFPQALQHDIPLTPAQCGGPLINLDGHCIGINVSRAGRVKTYAIPSPLIKTLLVETDGDLAKVPVKKDTGVSPREIDEINRTLEEIQSSLKALEKRLESVPNR